MKYDKVYYCSCYAVAKDYKYMARIYESASPSVRIHKSGKITILILTIKK